MKSRSAGIDTDYLDLSRPGEFHPQRFAASKQGMVSTAHYRATEIGASTLAAGGNAVDAAVAAAVALSVCEPAASGLGGQTMMLIHTAEPRQTVALDGSSRAPNRAAPELFSDRAHRRRGHTATTVPSTPAVLSYALSRFGRLQWSRVLEPAVDLAENGYAVTRLQNLLTQRDVKPLREGSAGRFFLRNGMRPFPAGFLLRQPVLAQTLRRLATAGVEDFYQGETAGLIQADMEANGGLLQLDDLAQIPWPVERRPISCRFGGERILTFPPPGAGRALVEMLQIIDHVPEKLRDFNTPRGALVLVETIRQAYLDRRDRPFDPTFFQHVEDKTVLSVEYARKIADRIQRKLRAKRRPPKTQGDTTHLSVMDRDGNVVALTQSIERVYGSFAASPELGFLYNNYMSAFDYEDMSHPYYMRPNASPWASVAPTIVFRGRRPWLVIGSPGSERIAPSIMQVFLRLSKQSPYDAVAAPRLHCSLDGTVSLEASRMRSDIPRTLAEHGFIIRERDAYSFYLGCVQLVLRERGTFVGVADPRRDGSAGGPD
jgi:gamma-glutamyltranspeptidase/glutathione hydrolase